MASEVGRMMKGRCDTRNERIIREVVRVEIRSSFKGNERWQSKENGPG